jgi:sulfite oxidase
MLMTQSLEGIGHKKSLPMAVFLAGMSLTLAATALADGLLIERNARPLLAEGNPTALESWETPLEGFFVRSHHNVMPEKFDDSWSIAFDGQVSKPQKITVRDLKKRPQTSFHAVLECSGNRRGLFSPQVPGIQWNRGAVGNAEWTGVPFGDVIKTLGVKPEATIVTIEGFDDPVTNSEASRGAKFVRSIPLKLLLETKSIFALKMNRQPLPVLHGGPVRLVMPGIFGQNWVKWVNKITFSDKPDERLYAKKAYRMPDKTLKPGEAWDPVKNGKPIEYLKVQTIFTSPVNNAKLPTGNVTVRGKAFSGAGSIEQVDISIDRGTTWIPAKLTPAKDYAWQEFELEVAVLEGVACEAWARATDIKGNVQPLELEWNPKGYLYNAVDRVRYSGDKAGAILAEGAQLAETHCVTCHSLGIATGQRLDKNDWMKTVKKMADYGLKLADADAEKISAYYASRYAVGTPPDDSKLVDLSADPSSLVSTRAQHQTQNQTQKRGQHPSDGATLASGQKLFATHCASCHGLKGEGLIGPVLRGRALTDATFFSSVTNGKRLMPAFKDRLSSEQMSSIRDWL